MYWNQSKQIAHMVHFDFVEGYNTSDRSAVAAGRHAVPQGSMGIAAESAIYLAKSHGAF